MNIRIRMSIMTSRFSSKPWRRSYCTYKNALTSQLVRSRFLDYFVKEEDHSFIKSIPVASYFDSSIPFINAGMCQFKRVFTGEEEINCNKAANTQKCIRIGGKHNDLNLVGFDLYHHTFFEMLGNWSFGAYSRKEACAMAWHLLTSAPFSISPNRVFVTYFGGDENLNLPADDEVREIWLELGIPPNRILPFGFKENFWEMGLTGPCGTCTEIHVALDDSLCSRSDLVNKNNPLLAELWNIVFIKFNKTENSLEKLPKEFVDTGMGFERLVALLQGKTSNYDTDLFVPLLDKISEMSRAPKYSGSLDWNSLDHPYRCLADFSRMITIAVSDNIFPDLNPKLRRILRKALFLAKYKFDYRKPAVLLSELSYQIAEIYLEIFPEIGDNLQKVKYIVEHESQIVQNMTDDNYKKWNHKMEKYPILNSFQFIEYPGLVTAFESILNETKSMKKGDYIPAKLIHFLYDTYGLDQPVVAKLMDKLEFRVNWNEMEDYLKQVKDTSRKSSVVSSDFFCTLQNIGIKTDSSPVHSFTKDYDTGFYNFPETKTKLSAVVNSNSIQSIAVPTNEFTSLYRAEVEIDSNETGFIFERSNFFSSESGHCCDKGEITILTENGNIPFKVIKVKSARNLIIHYVEPCNSDSKIVLKSGADALLKINPVKRMSIMQHYTLTHLVLKVLEDLYPLVYYKNSFVLPDYLKVICKKLGKKFDFGGDKRFIEERIAKYISDGLSVEKIILPTGREVFSLPYFKFNPGVHYPPCNVQAVNFLNRNGKIVFSEFCSGVHLLNTQDLKNFEIISLKEKESSDLILTCRVGDHVQNMSDEEQVLEEDSKKFTDRAKTLLNYDDVTVGQLIDFSDELSRYLYKMHADVKNKKLVLSARVNNILLLYTSLRKDIFKRTERLSRESIVRELVSRIQQNTADKKFFVHLCLLEYTWFQHNSFKVDIVFRNKLPTMMFHYSGRQKYLTGVCYVPTSFVKESFNANVWLKSTGEICNFDVIEEEDMKNYCFMKKKVPEYSIHSCLKPLLETSADVAERFLK